MSGAPAPSGAPLAALHAETDARFAAATEGLAIGCGRGCSGCCVDDLSVWEVEAARIAASVSAPVQVHSPGACAFLDPRGACQIYAARPYVCRSQGAVLRWQDDDGERRATCAEHLHGVPLERLSLRQTFALGPAETRLLTLATEHHAVTGRRGLPKRIALRDLAERLSRDPADPDA